MKRIIGCAISCALILVVFAGCETYKPYASPGTPPPKLTRAAILMEPNSKEKAKRAEDIATVLQKRGIEAVIVPPGEPVPRDVDGYFTYNDKWEWDLTMYLADMQIELHDTQTSRLIASARYKQSWVHRYPDPIEIVDNLVGQILGEPLPKPSHEAPHESSELIKH
jgi:hypothetical protein